jgi:PAS domain S-box-containing protein
MLKRLRQFRVIAGGAPTSIPDHYGDEMDPVAQQINELSLAVSQLRAQQRSEDEVLAAKRFTDNIIRSMFDVLIVTDADLKIVTVNDAACALLEYTELELVGKPITEIFQEQTMGMGPSVPEQLRSNAMRDNEMTYRAASGKLVQALVSASTMRDNAGQPQAIITVGKDITERKRIERDLLEAKIAAEAANRAKSAFVANMSHEIRTPMTAILGYADLLTRANTSTEDRDRCVQTICRNGRHLLSIINDILDVSKIEAGKMTTESIPCAPMQIIQDVCALMAVRAADKNLTFNVHYTGAIPSTIQTDPTRLRQILVNLLGNAIKFTERGSVKLVVSLIEEQGDRSKLLRGKSFLRFDVVDSGVGLNPSQIESLFRPFVQADSSTTRKFGGTGLGLTISKRLAKMLGGDLIIRSVIGSGSTFSLTIETGDLTDVSMIDRSSLSSGDNGATNSQSNSTTENVKLTGRVLLAEDGPDNRVLITYYLRELGLEVSAVENGLLARDRALAAKKDNRPFDLILMDMQMPELDGYEATRQLRATGYQHGIVALTAHAMGGDRDKCLDAGCDDFAVKPIEWEKLLAVLKRFLREETEQSPRLTTPTPNPTTAPPSSNPQLGALMAKPRMAKLVEKFLGKLDDRMTAIRAAADAQDAQQLKVLAHQLKGAAGGYGFPAISDAARAIEQSELGDLDALMRTINGLAELCNSAKQSVASTSGLSEAESGEKISS